MKIINVMITGFSLLIYASPSLAEVIPTVSYKYYTVNVTNKDDAAKNAFAVTPIQVNGKSFLGLTNCNTRYKYWYDRNANRCKLSEYKISNDCVVTLPKFVGGDAMLQKTLAMFVEKLKEHELVHCRISIEHAYKLDRAFKALGRHDCDDLAAELKRIYQRISEETSQAQKRFDNLGDHGRHEGANIRWFLSQFPENQGGSGTTSGSGNNQSKNPVAPNPANDQTQEPMEGLSNYYKDENGVWKNYK